MRARAQISRFRGSASASTSSPMLQRAVGESRRAHRGATDTAAVLEAIEDPGAPLDGETRSWMEPRFGRDFSHVRVHEGPRAQRSADALEARAYSVGRHIVVGPGGLSPHSARGRWDLAHELAHVSQQSARSARSRPPEARQAALAAAVQPATPAPIHVARLPQQGAPRPQLPAQQTGAGGQSPQPAQLTTQGCDATQEGEIETSLPEAHRLVGQTVAALSSSHGIARGSVVGQALSFSFKTTSPAVALHVRSRFMQARALLSALLNRGIGTLAPPSTTPSLRCHTAAADPVCNTATAYVPALTPGQATREAMIFCPRFFNRQHEQPGIILHEVMHALVVGEHVGDRGYSHARYFPDLTTEEALTNADSYRIFMEHVTTGQAPRVGHIFVDNLDACDAQQEGLLRSTFSQAQQWLNVAQRVTSDRRAEWLALPYWRQVRQQFLGGLQVPLIDAADTVYRSLLGQLGMFVSARCHSQADATCPAGTPTATASGVLGPEVQACPDWFAETDRAERTVLMIAELAHGAGVATRPEQMNLARMAAKLFTDLGTAPDLDRILGRSPAGDFPTPGPDITHLA